MEVGVELVEQMRKVALLVEEEVQQQLVLELQKVYLAEVKEMVGNTCFATADELQQMTTVVVVMVLVVAVEVVLAEAEVKQMAFEKAEEVVVLHFLQKQKLRFFEMVEEVALVKCVGVEDLLLMVCKGLLVALVE